MKSGSLFDNVLICDDPDYAKKLADETWGKLKDVRVFKYQSQWTQLTLFLVSDENSQSNIVLQAEKAAFDEIEKKKEEEVTLCQLNISPI